MSEGPRFLIIRLSAIGDVIHGLPVACALREAFPGCTIGWAVEGRSADLLRGHPAVDRVIAAPKGWLKSFSALWQLRQEMRQGCFDTALDLQGLAKSAIAGWLSGAKRRVGFAPPEARELAHWLYTERICPAEPHVVDRCRELLTPLGVTPGPARFDLSPAAETQEQVDRALKSAGIEPPFAVVNPGAGWPSKRWPPERFAEVAGHLAQVHGLPVVATWAGEEEREMAETIRAGAPEAVTLAPPTDLPQLVALLHRARVCIASDTGPLHIAAAVGTPCVGLYGPMPAERNGPYGAHTVPVQRARIEGGARARRKAGPESMLAIGTADVVEACDSLLQEADESC